MEEVLINASTLQDQFKLSKADLDDVLRKIGAKPLASAMIHGVSTQLFDAKEVTRMIRNELDRRESIKAHTNVVPIDQAPSWRDAMRGLEGNIIATCEAIEEKVDRIEALGEKLQEQNRLLLRAIESLRSDHAKSHTEPVAPAASNASPAEIAAPAASAKSASPRRSRALIFCAPEGSKAELIKEFEDCLDLQFRASPQMAGLASDVQKADFVFVMQRFTDGKIGELKRHSGAKLSLVNGGVSSLRDALTERFIANKKSAA